MGSNISVNGNCSRNFAIYLNDNLRRMQEYPPNKSILDAISDRTLYPCSSYRAINYFREMLQFHFIYDCHATGTQCIQNHNHIEQDRFIAALQLPVMRCGDGFNLKLSIGVQYVCYILVDKNTNMDGWTEEDKKNARYVVGDSWRNDRRIVRVCGQSYSLTVDKIVKENEVDNYTMWGSMPNSYRDLTIILFEDKK